MTTCQCYIVEFIKIAETIRRQTTERTTISSRPGKSIDTEDLMFVDIRIPVQGAISQSYQSVHFGAEVTIKDVPFELAHDFAAAAEKIAFERLHAQEEEAQNTLNHYLEIRDADSR